MKSIKILLCLLFATQMLYAQKTADVYVDKNGVMRWGKTKEEVKGFGINYTAPFAHAYRSAKKLNVDLEKAIDDDVYHFARLGFDAFRVHVWDTEISDSVGNLLENDHLRIFDYMLNKMKERGMKFVLTPIAYWGNGYPEPEEKTPGFAKKYGKGACLKNVDAIKAQEKYLFQFLNHVNPYTKISYKNDPDIIAFEISNEPHHGGTPDEVTAFIKKMVTSMRNTGCKKPIFYNISHSIHLVDAYYNAGIQGGTFQWYPTGLGAQHELRGNFLPNVDKYKIPFADNVKFKNSAKIVYEFDAADVGRSYIYPAMARSFRTAGIQWAAHFAYDPTYMAYANTEYNTHYMNLVYAPQKALSLKLASEVFHNVPMYKDYGTYPGNASFDAFHVSYEKDLAEMVTDTKFIYTNDTDTKPSSPEKLQEIAGYGNSSVVTYKGMGAYFLDKIENGVWRLEVMPDAVWVDNIFGRNSLKKEVSVVKWNTWPMTVDLSDLGENFNVTAINEGNSNLVKTSGKDFNIMPGTYLLVKNGTSTKWKGSDRWKNITLSEFIAPASTVKKTYVIHSPLQTAAAKQQINIEATVVSPETPQSVQLNVYAGFRPVVYKMEQGDAYTYTATIPADMLREGMLRYYVTVTEKDEAKTFPSGLPGAPSDWDFNSHEAYEVAIVAAKSNLYLFNAMTDGDQLSREWRRGSTLLPTGEPGKAELHVNVEKLFIPDPEDPNKTKFYDYSLRYNYREKIAGRSEDLNSATKIILRGRTLNETPSKIQVALISKSGNAYGGLITLDAMTGNYELPLGQLKPVKMVTLPRPYPTFLPYYFEGGSTKPFDISETETIQISIGPGLTDAEAQGKHGFAVESIWVE